MNENQNFDNNFSQSDETNNQNPVYQQQYTEQYPQYPAQYSQPNPSYNPNMQYYGNPSAIPPAVYSEPKKQKADNSGKGLKAMACVLGGITIMLCTVLFCSIFMNANDNVRPDSSSSSAADSSQTNNDGKNNNSSANAANKDDNNKGETESSAENTNSNDKNLDVSSWIELSSKGDALTIPEVVEKVMPSVVGISTTVEYEYNYGFQSGTTTAVSTGTGVIMSEDGYVITNAHVVDSGIDFTVILLETNEEYSAELIAADAQADLAVLKIDADNLTPAEFGDSSELVVGETAIAIGNPLGFELSGSVTCGIISALNREITVDDRTMTLIQTDAAINSGNSGGPLVNCYGQVIGINSIKMSASYTETSIEGLGFAIPSNEMKIIIDDLLNHGYVTGRPQLGINCVDVTESVSSMYNLPMGAYVRSFSENSAAEAAGVMAGDVIVAANGTEISSTDELNQIKNEFSAGDTLTLTVVRNGQEIEIDVVLREQGGNNN
ncbi:MAG: trypsin-like peptidase domain-containing protein [Oscillospiraceae bacterium]|nr:trypsin-like peptidase domain-containing protein [Oscillospiraceae bacterium]